MFSIFLVEITSTTEDNYTIAERATVISIVLLIFVCLGGFFFLLLYHGLQRAREHEAEERFNDDDIQYGFMHSRVLSIVSIEQTYPEVVINIQNCDSQLSADNEMTMDRKNASESNSKGEITGKEMDCAEEIPVGSKTLEGGSNVDARE